MSLRNALGDLALDATLRDQRDKLLNALSTLTARVGTLSDPAIGTVNARLELLRHGTRATRKLIDWYNPGGGSVLPRYKGFGPQGAAVADPVFTVYRQTWALQSDGTYKITDEQVLVNVPWGANRAARDGMSWS